MAAGTEHLIGRLRPGGSTPARRSGGAAPWRRPETICGTPWHESQGSPPQQRPPTSSMASMTRVPFSHGSPNEGCPRSRSLCGRAACGGRPHGRSGTPRPPCRGARRCGRFRLRRLRRAFFPDTDRRHLVAASAANGAWADEVGTWGKAPACASPQQSCPTWTSARRPLLAQAAFAEMTPLWTGATGAQQAAGPHLRQRTDFEPSPLRGIDNRFQVTLVWVPRRSTTGLCPPCAPLW